jgi:hypothetical protein
MTICHVALTVLAGVYSELGVTEWAAALTDQALGIHERLHGADSELIGMNLRQKASLAIARGDADSGDRLGRGAPRRLSLRGVHRDEAVKRFRRVEPQRCAKVSEIE